ncbi:MAG: diphthine synthase [Candidatus Nanohaloarchaea archaeon]
MLHIIGLGLDEDEITLRGMKALESADIAYAEFYTNTQTIDLERLEERSGTEIKKLERDKVEREDRIMESAMERETAFLVSGDPLTATTHFDIKHRAEESGVETEVIHAPSIFTSIAETGLSIYRFGRTVTLPRDSKPESITEYIQKNDSIGLHTLVLLDIDYRAEKAAEKLVEMDSTLEHRDAVVLERANQESQSVTRGELGGLADKEFGETPHSIIITGELSHTEKKFLG